MQSSLEPFPTLAAFLAGAPCRWADLGIDEPTMLEIAESEALSTLIVDRLSHVTSGDWPAHVRDRLTAAARAHTCEELARAPEVRRVLAALADAGVRPLLIKGTALAYTLYDIPAARPRLDTDLLIDQADVDTTCRVFAQLGYSAPDYCADLFAQVELEKRDTEGVTHVFDVHWRISTQPVFHHLLSYREAIGRARCVRGLGPHALTLDLVDSLLLACVHPVMHHHNEAAALWMYDIHLLTQRLAAPQFADFVTRARERRVARICTHQLRRVQTLFRTDVPPRVLAELESSAHAEPSAVYLASERRWHHDLVCGIRALPSVGARTRLLRQVLLPNHHYMLGRYGIRDNRFAVLLLPALYVHRNVCGIWKVLAGKK